MPPDTAFCSLPMVLLALKRIVQVFAAFASACSRSRLFWAWLLILVWPATVLARLPEPPEVAARAYLLLDVTTNQVLAARDPDMEVEPASLTKLMTGVPGASRWSRPSP